MASTDTLVIGAGPAGLAMAGRLTMAGRAYHLIEKSDRLVNAWHRHYTRLHLHSTRRFSALPGMPFPRSFPRFVPRLRFIDYCIDYAEHFGIRPEYGAVARRIAPGPDGWVTTLADGRSIASRHVVIATGLNHVPNVPDWPGFDTFAGSNCHSRDYRDGEPFRGRTVLVVGMGNTGAEIALDLAEHGARPIISVRGAVNIVRRTVLGSATTDTALLLEKSRLPRCVVDGFANLFQKLTVGDLSRYGLETRRESPTRQQRSRGATPTIDVGTVAAIKAGRIAVRTGIDRFEGERVWFVDGREERIDAVILATGYRPDLGPLLAEVEGIEAFLDGNGTPTDLWSPEHPGLYFLGFSYCLSGLLYCIGQDSGRILRDMEG